jgi:hypothetical protein
MTIICVKDGVIAADGSSWMGAVLVHKDARKIVRSVDDAIGGSTGCTSDTTIFRNWFAETESIVTRSALQPRDSALVFEEKSGFSALWLEPGGDVWMMEFDGKPYFVGREPQSIGGAWQLALGAMYAGASSEEAVRICVERSQYAAGEVFVARLASVEKPSEEAPIEVVDERVLEALQAPSQGWAVRMGLA